MGLNPIQPMHRVGLLGGSFDPVHLAHLALARQAREALELNAIWWIPAGKPWQKASLGASPEDRLAMLELALSQDVNMRILPLEIQRNGPTYTIDTLDELTATYPHTRFVWLLGSDQLRNFCTWHRWSDIVLQVDLAVAQRPGHTLVAPPELAAFLQEHGRTLLHLPFEPLELSATTIRQRVAEGLSIRHLVPGPVADYIQRHQLYSAGSA